VIAVGVILALLPVASLGVTAFALLTGSDVHKYLPLGVLLWEAKYADKVRANAIAGEVLSRYNGKALDAKGAERAIACALDMQERERVPWAEEWGDLIESANVDGKLSKEDLERYHAHAAVLEFHARPRVPVGGAVPVVVKLKEARIGTSSALMSMVFLKGAKLGGQEAHRRTGGDFQFGEGIIGQFQMSGSKSRWGMMMPAGEAAFVLAAPEGAAPGPMPLELEIGVHTISQPMSMYTWPQPSEVPTTHTDRRTVQVVSADQEAVQMVHPGAEAKERMERLLTPSQVMVWNGGFNSQAMMQFNVGDPPVPAAFAVFWRVGESEWKMGSFSTGLSGGGDKDEQIMMNWGAGGDQRSVMGRAPSFKGNKVDIILRPSAEAALRTTDITSIYGDEIVYKDVSVQRQDAGGSVGGSVLQWLFGR
jgi:hypothetical protein